VTRKKLDELMQLGETQRMYDRFMGSLADSHPAIASKPFGFTLGDDASIKIIDNGNSLTETDKQTLTGLINNFETFQSRLQGHAKTLMTLVDHDYESFGNRYRLDLGNFQNVIDFRGIFSVGFNKMETEWVRQIEANAETRDRPYISVAVWQVCF
jgi:hypothetical protein